MSVRGAIYDILSAVEADTYPVAAPQETVSPYAVYSTRFDYVRTQSGIQVTEVYLTLTIYADTFSACSTLAESFFSALEGDSGTYDTETLTISYITGQTDGYISELDKYLITQDYTLKFQ